MYNYSEKCAKAHEEQNRKRHEQTEAKYKRLFSEQGQDENFEFVCYEKNKKIRVKCKKCGLECIYGDDPLALLYPTMDHIIPISKGGGHTWDNVQIAHRICNINKSNLIGEEWKNAS